MISRKMPCQSGAGEGANGIRGMSRDISPCVLNDVSYIQNEAGRKCVNTPGPGAVPRISRIQFAAPEEWVVPQGQSCLQVKLTQYQGHKNARHNRGKDVHKELSHRQHLLSENCPTHFLVHLSRHGNVRDSRAF